MACVTFSRFHAGTMCCLISKHGTEQSFVIRYLEEKPSGVAGRLPVAWDCAYGTWKPDVYPPLELLSEKIATAAAPELVSEMSAVALPLASVVMLPTW